MRKGILAIGIVSMFLITGLAGVASASTYRGIVSNLTLDDDLVYNGTSLAGFIDEEFYTGKITIKGGIMALPTSVIRLPMLKLFHRLIFPVIILEGKDASKVL